MTDRELLELAAKAAGIELEEYVEKVDLRESLHYGGPAFWISGGLKEFMDPLWNPLSDDGDALRLAVKLKMGLHYESQFFDGHTHRIVEVYHSHEDDKCQCEMAAYTDDPFAATRRAIVMAAAEIGRQMKGGAA